MGEMIMRLIACLAVWLSCGSVLAQVKPDGELERLQSTAAKAREAAAADPTIKNAQSPPVLAYLIEQKRRRLNSTAKLRQRIEQYSGDKNREDLIPILKEQLADLEQKPLDQVSFDSAYGYQPTTGLVGYSKKVRLIENTSDGKSVILVENTALVIEGLGTSQYPGGKFFNVEKAILIGVQGADQLFQGAKKKSYAATLVDLESVLQAAPASTVAPASKGAAGPIVVDIWPGKVPDDAGIAGDEKFFELKVGGKPYEVGGKPTRWLTNVTKPTLTVYRAPRDNNAGVTMLICPGGGYHNLGWDVEGEEVAAWLNSIGMTGIIVKYRCPRREGDLKGLPPLGPVKDAQRALSLVRSKAGEWGIDPQKIGMVGFSAGGHLVGAAATNFDKRTYEPIDGIDKVSCRPDFAVMLYSGYFKVNDQDELSPTIRVTADAPPLFFVHATDDPISAVDHSVIMYLAMKRAGVPAELHVYATGGHGFAVRKVAHPCSTWTDRCTDWLQNRGILESTPRRQGPAPQ